MKKDEHERNVLELSTIYKQNPSMRPRAVLLTSSYDLY